MTRRSPDSGCFNAGGVDHSDSIKWLSDDTSKTTAIGPGDAIHGNDRGEAQQEHGVRMGHPRPVVLLQDAIRGFDPGKLFKDEPVSQPLHSRLVKTRHARIKRLRPEAISFTAGWNHAGLKASVMMEATKHRGRFGDMARCSPGSADAAHAGCRLAGGGC